MAVRIFFQSFAVFLLYWLTMGALLGIDSSALNKIFNILDNRMMSTGVIVKVIFYSMEICGPILIMIRIYESIMRKLLGFSCEEIEKSFGVIQKIAGVLLSVMALISLYYTAFPGGVGSASKVDTINFGFSVGAFYLDLSLAIYAGVRNTWKEALSDEIRVFG